MIKLVFILKQYIGIQIQRFTEIYFNFSFHENIIINFTP